MWKNNFYLKLYRWRKIVGNWVKKRSTAQSLKAQLRNQGIHRSDLKSVHVLETYKKMNKQGSGPDFDTANELLKSLPPAEPIDCEICGVIIETRCHENIAPVINSFLENVDMPVQIFHGNRNGDYLRSEIALENQRKIVFSELPTNELSASVYNAILLSDRFWKSLIGRNKILVFQTDSIQCSNSRYSISDFLDFDYIGAQWNRNRPIRIIADGGCGGLSLRDWKLSVECLSRFPGDNWPGGEDGYFAFHMDLMGGKVGDFRSCSKFASQGAFLENSWGVHQPNYMGRIERELFLRYCPEARILF